MYPALTIDSYTNVAYILDLLRFHLSSLFSRIYCIQLIRLFLNLTTLSLLVQFNDLIITMSLESDLIIDASKFDRSTINEQTLVFNQKLIEIWADGPR
jgi:hypothetical protein